MLFISRKITVITDFQHPKVTQSFKVYCSYYVSQYEHTDMFYAQVRSTVWLIHTSDFTS
jgi:hypothetical protein